MVKIALSDIQRSVGGRDAKLFLRSFLALAWGRQQSSQHTVGFEVALRWSATFSGVVIGRDSEAHLDDSSQAGKCRRHMQPFCLHGCCVHIGLIGDVVEDLEFRLGG